MQADATRRGMVISRLWLQGAILTFVFGFTILGFLAVAIYQDKPPMPGRVLDPAGRVVFTRGDILAGQSVFEKYALMEYGTVLGHGAILGPDFTAEYLHTQAEEMARLYSQGPPAQPSFVAQEQVARELHENRYDPASDTLGGEYFQAVAGRRYAVGFVRDRSPRTAPR